MYLRECFIQNVGPIASLDLSFDVQPNGHPKPVVLVGKNGSGKTILLAYIIDALAELAKKHFSDIVRDQRVGHMPFLKVTSGGDTRSLSGHHICLLEFKDSEESFSYIEKVGGVEPVALVSQLRGRFDAVRSWPKDKPLYKQAVGKPERVKAAFESGAICFFPASRHERPHWLNVQAVTDDTVFGEFPRFEGRLGKPLVVERAAEDNRQWLMDVLLDSMMDFAAVSLLAGEAGAEQRVVFVPKEDNVSTVHNKLLLTLARQNVEQLLQAILEDPSARLVLNFRNAAFGRVGIRLGNGTVVPSLMHLSAGQSILFNLFATIIRYADQRNLNKSFHLEQIEGLIVVDEIDSHLHSDLQFHVLPKMLKLFPRVQFVVSSHSPLFLLGMEREFGTDGVQIVELPTGRGIGTERFEEFRRSFEVYRQTKAFEEEVETQLQHATKPLVFTEGQTDPVYVRTALELLGHSDLLSLLEIEQIGSSARGGTTGGGDSHLNKARTFLEHNQHRFNRRVLLLYDCDTGKPDAEFGHLAQRAIPRNDENKRAQSGIENLLPESLFEERFYSVQKKPRPDGGLVTVESLDKQRFCDWVCKERRMPEDFVMFETLLVPILRHFVGEALAPA